MFCLSYDPFKWDFITSKRNINSIRKRIAYTDIACDVTCTRKSVITRVVIRFLWHDAMHRITATSYNQCYYCHCFFGSLSVFDILLIKDSLKAICSKGLLYFSYLCDSICSIYSGTGKFCLAHGRKQLTRDV